MHGDELEIQGPDDSGRPEDPTRAEQRRRSGDRWQTFRDLLLAAAIVGFSIYGTVIFNAAQTASSHATAAASAVRSETRARAQQRISDERASCRRGSQKTAADVNLNWVYYQSESQLGKPTTSTAQTQRALALLTPGERSFIALLLKSGTSSRTALKARADADFDAAFVKAKTVDYRDLPYVATATPLGSEATPRAWVRRAHYDCDKSFSQ